MITPDNTKDVRIKVPTTGTRGARPLPSAQPARELPSLVDARAGEVVPRRRASDRWLAALTIVGLCVLAGALVAYVLYPAMTTLLDGSVVTWSGDGP